MLNAFRHHRLLRDLSRLCITTVYGGILKCSTPFGITDYCARQLRSTRRRWMSAQRLSASQIIARPRRLPQVSLSASRLDLQVLNAFRHHRLLRSASDSRRRGLADVLNAFRHHRLLRLRANRCALRNALISCSTPFGITDYCAVRLQLMVSKGQTGLNFMHRPESDIGHKRFMFSCNRNAAIPQPIRWQALHDLS